MTPLEESLLGHIEALTELVYALSLQVDRDKFRDDAIKCLEVRKRARLSTGEAPDTPAVHALERMQAWVRLSSM